MYDASRISHAVCIPLISRLKLAKLAMIVMLNEAVRTKKLPLTSPWKRFEGGAKKSTEALAGSNLKWIY